MPTTPAQSLDSSPLWTDSGPLAPLLPLPPNFFDVDLTSPRGHVDSSLVLTRIHDDTPPVSTIAGGTVPAHPPTPRTSPEACPIQTNRGPRCNDAFSDEFTLARHVVCKHMRRDPTIPLNSSGREIDHWLTEHGITDRSVRGSAKRRFMKLRLWECATCGRSFGREEALKEHEKTLSGRCAQRKLRAVKRRRGSSALDPPSDSSSSVSSSTSPLPFSPTFGGYAGGGTAASGVPLPDPGLLYVPPSAATPSLAPFMPFFPSMGGHMLLYPSVPLQFPLMGGMMPDGSWHENDFGAYPAPQPNAPDFDALAENYVDFSQFDLLSSSPPDLGV